MKNLFWLGTTSYILTDNLVANAAYLAGKVRDIELVLFDLDDGTSNLPSPEVVDQLLALAQEYDLTYTVHLPMDVRPGGDQNHASLRKARKTIEATRTLEPWAYIVHLDGREVRHESSLAELEYWQSGMVRTLKLLGEWAGGLNKLAVENLEGYPPDFVQPVVDQLEVGRCVDLGHYWLDGVNPLPYLQAALPRTRVIHLHGVNGRDHQSLVHIAPDKLHTVLKLLSAENYAGVLTMEVFGEQDFQSSLEVMRAALARDGYEL